MDTQKAIPEPDPAMAKRSADQKCAARERSAYEAGRVRDHWTEQRVSELSQTIVNSTTLDSAQAHARATQTVERALMRNDLLGDWQLEVKSPDMDGTVVTVAVGEILDNPYRWHGCLTKDPLEPGYDGGRWVGKLYLISARPMLHSKAHGGQNFRLCRQLERIEIVHGKLAETVNSLFEFCVARQISSTMGRKWWLCPVMHKYFALEKTTCAILLPDSRNSGTGVKIQEAKNAPRCKQTRRLMSALRYWRSTADVD